MAHFALVNKHDTVETVVFINNSVLLDDSGNEVEQKGVDALPDLPDKKWVQTSYNENFRGKYAGYGDIYNVELDVFHPPCPYENWTLNEETFMWESPVLVPSDDQIYRWNENDLAWESIE